MITRSISDYKEKLCVTLWLKDFEIYLAYLIKLKHRVFLIIT